MTDAFVTYPGIVCVKGVTYTQTRGVEPDAISLRIIPQSTPIPATGNVSLYWLVNSVTTDAIIIRDCLADKSNIWLNEKGFTGTVIFQDRRWRWSRAQRYAWHVNERNSNGDVILASKYSLRAIFQDLFDWIGEGNVNVSQVSDSFYPELDLVCVKADEIIADLCSQYGYEVCLGFGDQPVEVWPMGQGRYVSTTGCEIMRISEALDPPTNPKYSQVCFGSSEAQARFFAVPVGKETNGTWNHIDNLSYKPAGGWKTEPAGMPNVETEHGLFAADLARESVYRWYAMIGFADGYVDEFNGSWTYSFPDGSGALTHISQCYPFFDKLLEVEENASTGQPTHPPPRVYANMNSPLAWCLPFGLGALLGGVDQEVTIPFDFDRNRGLIKFEEPVVRFGVGANLGEIHPALVYVEAAFRIRDVQTRQFISYVHTVVADPNGFGVESHHESNDYARTIVSYNDNQVVASTSSNRADLDNTAAALHAATPGLYTFAQRRVVHYNKLMGGARCDGLCSQVKHTVSDETGHHTVIAQNMDYDAFIRTAQERKQSRSVERVRREWVTSHAKLTRAENAND